jgi:hypothetical protein
VVKGFGLGADDREVEGWLVLFFGPKEDRAPMLVFA